MSEDLQILLLEDNELDAELTKGVLKAEGLTVKLHRVDTGADFETALKGGGFHLIISDYSLPSFNGKRALELARSISPDLPFIFYSGTIGEDSAVEVLKKGATDYVLKQRPQRLASAVRRALQEVEIRQQQRKAQEQIASQAHLLDLARDGIIVKDLSGRVIYWNQGARQIFGCESEQAIGRSLKDLVFSGNPAYLQALQATTSLGEWSGELEAATPQGNRVTVSSSWTLVRKPNGQPEKILTINTDITQKKSLEAQFLRAQRLESIGTLASGVAHDLNNILAPIFMSTELLRSAPMDESSAAMVEIIQKSAQRGAEIVKQVLTFVRGSEGKRLPLDAGGLVKEVGKLVTGTFPKNIEVQYDVQAGLTPIVGDATQLHQVLMNLAINARDAMPGGGQLRISARMTTEETGDVPPELGAFSRPFLLLEVSDTGTGIPPEVIERIFDPFFTTKGPGKGTGLGLSTVSGIVKSHEGKLSVKSRPGQGTTFQIVLPCLRTAPAASEGKSGPARRGRGELILVVDDEKEIRESMAKVLMQHGYGVITAPDGSSAVLQFMTHKNNLQAVVTDIMMPGADGPSFAETVKRVEPRIKVVLISGSQTGRENHPNADYFLPKPCLAGQLLDAVHSVLHAH